MELKAYGPEKKRKKKRNTLKSGSTASKLRNLQNQEA